MSAPAPALAPSTHRRMTVRLADVAAVTAWLSVVFGLAVVFFPATFPKMVADSWQSGRLTMAMSIFAVLVDLGLYLWLAHRLSVTPPYLLAGLCLGLLPVAIVTGLSMLLQSAVAYMLQGYFSNVQARVNEEVLTSTYLTLIASIFLPFLVIRLMQHFRAKSS